MSASDLGPKSYHHFIRPSSCYHWADGLECDFGSHIVSERAGQIEAEVERRMRGVKIERQSDKKAGGEIRGMKGVGIKVERKSKRELRGGS
jgi:hypothetical protein